MDYVEKYRRLEDRATGAESKVEEYRARAEADRWEQCRLAHGAVESGEFTRNSFARAVGKSGSTIGRQYDAYAAHGESASRPSYQEAMAQASGTTAAAESARIHMNHARYVLRDPAMTEQLIGGLDAGTAERVASNLAAAKPAAVARQAANPDVARAIARTPQAIEQVEEEAIRTRASSGYVPDPGRVGRAAANNANRALGGGDRATDELLQAARYLLSAKFYCDDFGIEDGDAEAEAIGRVERALRAYKNRTSLTADDRSWAAAHGITFEEV